MERRSSRDRRQAEPDTTRKLVLPNRRMDGIARRVADARAHAARMRVLYPRQRAAQAVWIGKLP